MLYDKEQKEDITKFFNEMNNTRADLDEPLKQALEFTDLDTKSREANGKWNTML